MEAGDKSNSSQLQMSVHFGTHVDAPYHFVPEGASIEKVPLDVLCGEAWVVEAKAVSGLIGLDDLESIPSGAKRVLFKTRNSEWWANPSHEFRRDFVAVGPDAAEALVARGVELVGVDYLSVQRFKVYEDRTHEILLKEGIAIIEGLNLQPISQGGYELICLPLRLRGSDAAPARVILRELR